MNMWSNASSVENELQQKEEAAVATARRKYDAQKIDDCLRTSLGGRVEVEAVMSLTKAIRKLGDKKYFAPTFGGHFQVCSSALKAAMDAWPTAAQSVNDHYEYSAVTRNPIEILIAFGVASVIENRKSGIPGLFHYSVDQANYLQMALQQIQNVDAAGNAGQAKAGFSNAREFVKAVQSHLAEVAIQRKEFTTVHLRLLYAEKSLRTENVWAVTAEVYSYLDAMRKDAVQNDCLGASWRIGHDRTCGYFVDLFIYGGKAATSVELVTWAVGIWAMVVRLPGEPFSLNLEDPSSVGLLGLGPIDREDARQLSRLEATITWGGRWDAYARLRSAGAPSWGVANFTRKP